MSNFKVLGCVEVALKSYPVWWVGRWAANTYIVMPLCGPTCKIARFEAELKVLEITLDVDDNVQVKFEDKDAAKIAT